MPFTTFLKNELIDHAFRNATYTPPASVYVALFTTATGDDGSGTEVAAGDYDRVAATFATAASGQSQNSVDVDFGSATSNWGTVTHFAVYDALTAGNMMGHAALASSKPVGSGDPVKFPVGDLTVSITNPA